MTRPAGGLTLPCREFLPRGVSYFLPLLSMFNVNRVTLLGSATRDPETHASKAGKTVAVFGLATIRRWKDLQGELQSEPEFHRIVCTGALAEFSSQHVRKGMPLYVEGRLHTSHRQTRNGKDASQTEILADQLVLLSAHKAGEVDATANEE